MTTSVEKLSKNLKRGLKISEPSRSSSSGQKINNNSSSCLEKKKNFKEVQPKREAKSKSTNPSSQNRKASSNQPSSVKSKPSRSVPPKPIAYIVWPGVDDEAHEPIGFMCILCGKDLSSPAIEEPVSNDDDDDDDDDSESDYYDDYDGGIDDHDRRLPDVSVLPCGHCFHSECFYADQLHDPSCGFCLSLS